MKTNLTGELPAALLLDLDDTILDDSGGTEAAWLAACSEAATRTPGLDAALLRQAIERTRTWYWADPARHREGRLDLLASRRLIIQQAIESLDARPADCATLATELAMLVHARRDAAICPLPGAVETLAALRKRGVRLALLTNGAGPPQRAKIERFSLAPHFEVILIEGENPWGKPDERVYHAALQALGAAAAEAWMVGDNLEWEVAVPQRLGMRGIWLDRTGAGLPPDTPVRPDRVIRSLTELLPEGVQA
ncbi:MAG TPA: HAD family hydrolase [Dehalococcoidia bacterium]